MRLYYISLLVLGFTFVSLQAVIDTEKVRDFVEKHTPVHELTYNEYVAYITLGEVVLKHILNDDKQPSFDRNAYITYIISILWYLYAIAVTKNQGFTHGVIIIEDPDKKLFNYFFNYVKQVNPEGLSKKVVSLTNLYGYGRVSSHFVRAQKLHTQYGIDIRKGGTDKIQKLLPCNKTHLLFGRLDEGHMFIKMEDHGLYIKDAFVGHVGGFIKSVGRQARSKLTGGKTEDKLARREQVPADIQKEYQMICRKNKLPAKATTIKDMLRENYGQRALRGFFRKLKKCYDHLPLRYGNEVILMEKDLR